ncbi:unnamed protein product, partial [Amoebophrya sp. A120]
RQDKFATSFAILESKGFPDKDSSGIVSWRILSDVEALAMARMIATTMARTRYAPRRPRAA